MAYRSREPLDREELLDLFDAACSGRLTVELCRKLETCLRADREAQVLYASYLQMHGALRWRMRGHEAGGAAPRPPISAPIDVPAPGSAWPGLLTGFGPLVVGFVVLLAVAAAVWWPFGGKEEPKRAGADAPVEVAVVSRQVDAVWADETVAPDEDDRLPAGRTLDLQSGLVEVRFHGGAEVIVEGPAVFEVLSGGSGRLASGRLTARVPETARGFAVETPRARIVDLGTEFGVEVQRDGAIVAHVFRGAVQLTTARTRRTLALGADGTARVEPRQETIVQAGVKPPVFVRQLTAAPTAETARPTVDGNIIRNGDFQTPQGDRPAGWQWGDPQFCSYENEGGNRFLRLKHDELGPSRVWQKVKLDPAWKGLTVAVRVRAADVKRGPNPWSTGCLQFVFRDAQGKQVGGWPKIVLDKDQDWNVRRMSRDIPGGATELTIECANWGGAGTFDFDDVTFVPTP